MFSNRQQQTLKQTLKVNPQQIQFLNFLHLNVQELDDYIKNELEENPFLEEGADYQASTENDRPDYDDFDDYADSANDRDRDFNWEDHFNPEEYDYGTPTYKTQTDNYAADDDESDYGSQPSVMYTFRDDAKEQMHFLNLSDKEQKIAEYVIDMIDDDGYLRRSIMDLTDDMSFGYNLFVTEEEVAKVKKMVQQLGIIGLAAADLQECLVLQLEHARHKGENVDLPLAIMSGHYKYFVNRDFEKIQEALHITYDDLKEAIERISKLSPNPVRGMSSSTIQTNHTIVPDYLIEWQNGQVVGRLNNPKNTFFAINESYVNSLNNHADKQTQAYVSNKVKSALWFIDAVQQRQQTMTRTIQAIVMLQEAYFKTGELRYLRPMVLKDVADYIGMEISTVSRVTSRKYAQTPFGVIGLKELFSDGIEANDGSMISNRQVKELVEKYIAEEDRTNPLTDLDIIEKLKGEGLHLSRRTITKYREALQIPASKLRKKV